MTVKESILHFNPDITEAELDNLEQVRALEIPLKDSYGLGKVQIEIFEKTVEDRLMNPTFITAKGAKPAPTPYGQAIRVKGGRR